MASPVRPMLRGLEAPASPRQLMSLTDDLLEEIFLRVVSRADLASASTACVSFRRLIADPSFLRRRRRSLHPPLLLGVFSLYFYRAEAPHPNAPAARALAGFSYGFVPRFDWCRGSWYQIDVRDGHVLLICGSVGPFPRLAVCDPMSRRYLVLPPIPDGLLVSKDLLASVRFRGLEALLVPSGGYEETSFRVIGWAYCNTEAVVIVFSSVSGRWSVSTSTSWDALGLNVPPKGFWLKLPHYAYGCFYWRVKPRKKFLKLDIDRMELSTLDYPPDHDEWDVVIVEAGEGRIGVFSRIEKDMSLCYAIWQSEGKNANEWRMENIIPLPDLRDFGLVGAAEGYIFLLGWPMSGGDLACFSLEIKTLKIERVCQMMSYTAYINLYFGFPPSMPERRI